ncbi:MAG: ubiquinol-cytochrome C chaperone family protein [Magnetococcales bacterium]|nr:ubiquinol-cytochrome C chaperone family protein [Magnetococcales bacterium]
MFSWRRFQERKQGAQTLRAEVLAHHDRLVESTRALSGAEWLALPDDFNLRFELLILLVSVQLFLWRRVAQPEAEARIAQLWEIVFEGFDNTLRLQGVSDIRMAGRIRKLLGYATGRRKAYLDALGGGDRHAFCAAIGRNVLNGAPADDPRVQQLITQTRATFPGDHFLLEDTETS